MKPTNVRDFFKQFPDDDTCLLHLFNVRFGQGHECPKCKRAAKWYRLHVHPMVGSIFEKSRTPLQLWFYAVFLFTTTRHGVSGKELQRQLGVTYKTAWRMAAKIREHMAAVDGEKPIGGEGKTVEIDETMVGGKRKGKRGRGAAGKTVVLGMMERDGDVATKVVPNVRRSTLEPIIEETVKPETEIHTDELASYNELDEKGYDCWMSLKSDPVR